MFAIIGHVFGEANPDWSGDRGSGLPTPPPKGSPKVKTWFQGSASYSGNSLTGVSILFLVAVASAISYNTVLDDNAPFHIKTFRFIDIRLIGCQPAVSILFGVELAALSALYHVSSTHIPRGTHRNHWNCM